MADKLKREFIFSLSANIGVQKDGEKQFCNEILLRAPAAKHTRERCILKQAVLSAINIASKNSDNKNDTEDSGEVDISEGESFVAPLYMHLSADEILKALDAFKALLTSGNGLALGIVLTNYHLDQLDAEDLDNMLGEYIVNFILPSWMKRVMKK